MRAGSSPSSGEFVRLVSRTANRSCEPQREIVTQSSLSASSIACVTSSLTTSVALPIWGPQPQSSSVRATRSRAARAERATGGSEARTIVARGWRASAASACRRRSASTR